MSDQPAHLLQDNVDAAERSIYEHFAAIGRLVVYWAHVEHALYGTLLRYGKLHPDVARAILSGSRASRMIDFLKALMENIKISEARKNDLELVFAQMSAINTMRDDMVHHHPVVLVEFHGANKRVPFLALSNADRASRLSNKIIQFISLETIDKMIEDIETITQHLRRHQTKGPFRPFRRVDAATWLYKSPQPARKPDKSRAVGQKHPIRRGSSRA